MSDVGETESGQIKTFLENNQRGEVSQHLFKSIVENNVHQLYCVGRFDVRISHAIHYLNIKKKKHPVFKQVITNDKCDWTPKRHSTLKWPRVASYHRWFFGKINSNDKDE